MTLDPNAPAPAPLSPMTTFQNQLNAVLRHGGTAVGAMITVLGALAFLPPDQAQKALEALQASGKDVHNLMGHLSDLWIILGPALMLLMAKFAAGSASLKSQLRSIARNPAADITPQSKIIVPPDVAKAVPIPQVVPPP
jgi:hypothetical protein